MTLDKSHKDTSSGYTLFLRTKTLAVFETLPETVNVILILSGKLWVNVLFSRKLTILEESMIPIEKNNNRFFLACSLLLATTYFAGSKRLIQNFPGATQKDLLGIAGVATIVSGILRHENNRKSALLTTSISLGTAVILTTLNTSLKWESSTFLKVGAVQALIFGGVFTQKKTYHDNGKLAYEGEWDNDKRHGQGKEYDEEGELFYEGQWQNGLRVL